MPGYNSGSIVASGKARMETSMNIIVPDHSDGSSDSGGRGMRWNLLWYIPLFALASWYVVFSNAKAAYENITIVSRHWTWMLLVSPSAYVFLATTIYAVLLPIHFMLFIPRFFSVNADRPTYDRRYPLSILVLLALIVGVFVMLAASRASFPLCWPSDGVERIRLVPFLPCPN